MDIFNMIFENYGGRKIENIFKSYLILSLIIKQIFFSLFFAPADPSAEHKWENDNQVFNEFSAESQQNVMEEFPIFQLIFDILETDTEEISAVQEPYK